MARGTLRVYLGTAPGVGKTYAMLSEGHRRRERGADIVVAYVETHNRPRTVELIEGLEVIARQQVEYRGASFTEMDLSAVLARKPKVALVDELAHTNVPEARNRKRYEDVDELLDASIDVTSTVNVQHLESLNDSVFELTGVRVRETFPDHVLDEADEVVLVDLTPEALQERLLAGKVYRADRVEAALQNFFRIDNLAALRELVLRELAEDVEAKRHTAVLDPLSQQAVAERILVLATPEPRSQRVLRRAFRSGARLGSEVDVLWMRRPGVALSDRDAVSLAALRRLASLLGAHFLEREGDNLPALVKQVAGERGSTYIFVGTPDESRRTEVLRGSLVSKLVRDLPGIDIRVVADRALREEEP
jgi:two-component system sensor histidine kinase KdpD